jgi:transposase-like protein
LAEVEACQNPGEVGAILRREGLFSSHLTRWRKAQRQGQLDRSAPMPRGPKANPKAPELARLKRENAKLQKKLRKAEQIIELQKKVSEVLGIALPALQTEDDDEMS